MPSAAPRRRPARGQEGPLNVETAQEVSAALALESVAA
jgi:hypothetical protein